MHTRRQGGPSMRCTPAAVASRPLRERSSRSRRDIWEAWSGRHPRLDHQRCGSSRRTLKPPNYQHATDDPNAGDDRLTGVAAVSDNGTFAVGSTLSDATGNLETLVLTGGAHTPWTRVTSPNPADDGDSQLSSVARVGHDLWATGGFDGPDAQQTLILHRCR